MKDKEARVMSEAFLAAPAGEFLLRAFLFVNISKPDGPQPSQVTISLGQTRLSLGGKAMPEIKKTKWPRVGLSGATARRGEGD